MNEETDYIKINQELWDGKTAIHMRSDFYRMEEFMAGENSLNDIELPLLGDVRGAKVLHLQCHFGKDTLSLARMGAQATGVDLSPAAIEQARVLNTRLGLDATFVCSDVYALPRVHEGLYDIVFASYGTIVWLPDMDKWARVVAHFLRPGGRLVFADFHPALMMYDDNLSRIAYPYFNTAPIVETENGTYADRDAAISLPAVTWNHNLAEVIQALLGAGLRLVSIGEYDYSPYACFGNMREVSPGRYMVKDMEGKMPIVYALVMEKA